MSSGASGVAWGSGESGEPALDRWLAAVADDRILKLTTFALENEVVGGRLRVDFFEHHLERATRTSRRFRRGLIEFEHAEPPLLGRRTGLSNTGTGVGVGSGSLG